MSDFNLSPTRHGYILDLFLTTIYTLMNSVNVIPGLSDHNIVKCLGDTNMFLKGYPLEAKTAPKN